MMDDAPATKMVVKFLVVGNVISVLEKHHRNAAEFLDTSDQRSRKAR
jgi:hypothetical protein